MFFSVLARGMTDFLLMNKSSTPQYRKVAFPACQGAWNIRGVVTQLIREAQEGNCDLVVLWLDLANAYGSIRQKLIETSLD